MTIAGDAWSVQRNSPSSALGKGMTTTVSSRKPFAYTNAAEDRCINRKAAWWLTRAMSTTTKLRMKASTAGTRCCSAIHNSRVLAISSAGGGLISMIRRVRAMAKTPSQNASRREIEAGADIGGRELETNVRIGG